MWIRALVLLPLVAFIALTGQAHRNATLAGSLLCDGDAGFRVPPPAWKGDAAFVVPPPVWDNDPGFSPWPTGTRDRQPCRDQEIVPAPTVTATPPLASPIAAPPPPPRPTPPATPGP